MKGRQLLVKHKQGLGQSLSLYHHRLLGFPNRCWQRWRRAIIGFPHQEPSDYVLHIIPNAGYGAMGNTVKTWSTVCLIATICNPVKERDHIVHEKMESPNISPQAIELNQAVQSKPILIGLVLVMGMKVRSLDVF